MLNIGCHLSVSKGYANMGNEALSIGANTFQFFTRNPRGGSFKALDLKDIQQLNQITEKYAFAPLLAHAPYTMNPCAAEDRVLQFAMQAMQEDLERLEHLHNVYYNFHPGSHVGQGVEVGIEKIITQLNALIKPNQKTKVLLETMAGKGTEVGRRFEELAQIIKGVNEKQHIGVCLDTCHIYDAGYDWVTALDDVLDQFDHIIGLDRLYAIHTNDSKNPFGSGKDRHECIGKGSIGLDAFERLINHPKLKHLPFYLETPNELPGYESEIKLLKSLYRE